MGLMQLMPSTAREYKVRNPYDPKANIAAGVKHLKSLIDRWGVELALAAYNAGEGRGQEVQRHPAVPRDAQLRQPNPLARRREVTRTTAARRFSLSNLKMPPAPGPTVSGWSAVI